MSRGAPDDSARIRNVLITGAAGQMGTVLQQQEWPADWNVVAVDRRQLDLTDIGAIRATIDAGADGAPWSVVINCAAFTSADKAESDIATAWAINTLAPATLAEACAINGIALIHISTDYVFSGDKAGAWDVDDIALPLSVYGASKLGGELAIRTSGVRHVIVRSSWIVSALGQNFVKTMLRVGAERGHLRVVHDQIGSPTSATDLAGVLMAIAITLAADADAPTGTFHFSNAGAVSWAGFASAIFRESARRGGPSATVEPIATTDYPTPARRPANSLLSTAALQHAYGIVPRPWQEALGDILDDLVGPLLKEDTA